MDATRGEPSKSLPKIGRNDFYLNQTAAEIDARIGQGRRLVPLYAESELHAAAERERVLREAALEEVLRAVEAIDEDCGFVERDKIVDALVALRRAALSPPSAAKEEMP